MLVNSMAPVKGLVFNLHLEKELFIKKSPKYKSNPNPWTQDLCLNEKYSIKGKKVFHAVYNNYNEIPN